MGSLVDISQALYLNVPRIATIASTRGLDVGHIEIPASGLHALGGELARVMFQLGRVLHDVELELVTVSSMKEIRRLEPGMRFSFEHALRTRNVLPPWESGRDSSPPFVYWHTKHVRLRMPIDPRWITYASAFSYLRPAGGKIRLAGIASVVAHERSLSTASLLILGMPQRPPRPSFPA
jgi:hypothetical protein